VDNEELAASVFAGVRERDVVARFCIDQTDWLQTASSG
jgi:hypothetical protein